MSRGPDAATLLQRALLDSAARAGCPVRLAAADWTRWASVTFSGARHMFAIEGEASDALDAWLAALPEAEFALSGHLVADLTVMSARRQGEAVRAEIEVLTVEVR
ncbi:hypothetical protein [Sphingomonas sp.]|uniref:hypothetical protein n=1 Tax=Sphingomonas sp. TaxID=28214 RepID=UPI001B1F68A6|nr:hypothetical protein [Sphingomonas sp.]MBO9711403.1 hypothetical protein [Sphingomonas sp.]